MHIWDLEQKRNLDVGPEAKRARNALPQELMLTHAGHRAPVRPHADAKAACSVASLSFSSRAGLLSLFSTEFYETPVHLWDSSLSLAGRILASVWQPVMSVCRWWTSSGTRTSPGR